MKNKLSFEEFEKTVYHSMLTIHIPLLGIKLSKVKYFTKGKYDANKVREELYKIYEQNLNKLNE